MAGLAGQTVSQAFAYSAASTANIFSSTFYYAGVYIENGLYSSAVAVPDDYQVPLLVTTDGSNPSTTNGFVVPGGCSAYFPNYLLQGQGNLPNWNVDPSTALPGTVTVSGSGEGSTGSTNPVTLQGANQYFGNYAPVSGTSQQGWVSSTGAGTAASFTNSVASPSVFTSSGLVYNANNTVVVLTGGSVSAAFTAATALGGGVVGVTASTYYIVNKSGATFNLAPTSGAGGINQTGSGGSGTVLLAKTVAAITPVSAATGTVTIVFQ